MRTTQMLRSAALTAVLVLVVAACGDDDTGAVATVDCAPGQVDGNLNFYNWSEYMDPDLITAFEAQYGVDVVESFYESNEAMLSQIQAGVAYDLVVPSDYMIKIMIDEGLVYQLDKEALTNYGNLAEEFRTQPYDPSGDFSVAYQYGTTGLGVNLNWSATHSCRVGRSCSTPS